MHGAPLNLLALKQNVLPRQCAVSGVEFRYLVRET